jgi:GAF domain-containing protein
VLDALLGALRKAVAFEQATAFVCTAGDGRLSPLVVEGAHVDLIPDIAFDHGAGFSSWVAKSRRPVLLSTDREEFDAAGEGRPGSFLSVPLLAEDELVGVLNLAHSRPGAFTGADRDFVVLAGRLAAAALRRLRQAPAAPAAGATSAVAESALARAGA